MKKHPSFASTMTNNSDNVSQSFNEKKRKDLMASLAIDALGMVTFLIPALGEAADVIIAPIISVLIYAVHRTTFGAIAGFLEEIIPFTDIIPSATIIWFYRYFLKRESTFNEFMEKINKKHPIIMNSK
ncbi:hypothetical protein GCM10027035_49940 [Emticicia sediminis]